MYKRSSKNNSYPWPKTSLVLVVLGLGLGTLVVNAGQKKVEVDYAKQGGFERIGSLSVGSKHPAINESSCNPTSRENSESCIGVSGDLLGSNLNATENIIAYSLDYGGSGTVSGGNIEISGSGKSITSSSLEGSGVRPVCADANGVLTNDNCTEDSSGSAATGYAWTTGDWGSCIGPSGTCEGTYDAGSQFIGGFLPGIGGTTGAEALNRISALLDITELGCSYVTLGAKSNSEKEKACKEKETCTWIPSDIEPKRIRSVFCRDISTGRLEWPDASNCSGLPKPVNEDTTGCTSTGM